uniref:Transmembrane protein 116 n=1 Tax=Leptobrachium leishanense TaxID=445787 RepID=A0A8C5PCY6_9ANUR
MEISMDLTTISGLVVANISDADSWNGVYSNIQALQAITAILSIIGSGFVSGYAFFQYGLKLQEACSFFCLSVSNLLLAICWLLGAFVFRKSDFSRDIVCYNIQAVGQILYLSTFFYTVNYMWQLCKSLKRTLDNTLDPISNTERCIAIAASIVSSVLPVCLAVPKLYIGNSNGCYGNSTNPHSCLVVNVGSLITIDWQAYTNDSCKQIHLYGTSGFLFVFFLTAVSMLVLLGYVLYFLRARQITDEQRVVIVMTKWRLLLLMIIFFFCSMSAVMLAFRKLVNHAEKSEIDEILYYFQSWCHIYRRTLQTEERGSGTPYNSAGCGYIRCPSCDTSKCECILFLHFI